MAKEELDPRLFTNSPLVWGIGPVPCSGLILGEAPGEAEAAALIPFVGASGKLLNEALEHAGLTRDRVYVTNAYKLRPEGNRTPNEAELNAHSKYLVDEFFTVLPTFVLTLGNVAMGVMTGKFTGILQERGKWQEPDTAFWGCQVLPTYHPSYVLRQGGRDTFVFEDFAADVRAFVERAF